MTFVKELKKLGLKDKEASVYLSCLELGASPVQPISRKSKVVRATTYVVLESLMKMGLVTKYKEGKKTLFSAEPPRQLMRLLEKQAEGIKERKHELDELLPELQMVTKTAGGKPTVRYFEGVEGLHAIRREMLMYSHSGDSWYNFTPIDHLDAVFGRQDMLYDRQRLAKKIKTKTIFTTKSEVIKKAVLESGYKNYIDRRYVPAQDFPVSSGMTIFRDRIAIGSFTGNLGGVIIESDSMAIMMKRIFDIAWEGAEKYLDN